MQGVGFRPYVYRLAGELGLAGLRAERRARRGGRGRGAAPRRWSASSRGCPPRRRRCASVERVIAEELAELGERGFAIRESPHGGEPRAAVTPDSATCADCLAELFDPADRRYRYPFINCTNCGPRFTIVRDVPYDRPNTTMAGFEMCAACRAEYDDPGDRRFHAQPNACPECGPRCGSPTPTGARSATPAPLDAVERRRACAARRGDRRGEGPRRLPPRLPRRRRGRRGARCARASTARTSRSR